jgi:nucleoside-diphosphate-sugar epimerase
MKNNLVIGANSFLGQELIFQELKLGNKITGVYNRNTNNLKQETNYISINDLFTIEISVDVMYFVSAYIPDDNVVEQKLFDTNVALLQKVKIHFPNAKIVLASSVSVYNESDQTITEESLTSPINTYGLSKLWAEYLLKEHRQFGIVRISSMYGVGMNLNTFIPKVIESAIEQSKINIYGDGERLQNYVHKSHVAKVMLKAAYLNQNGIYLAVSKNSISNKEVAKKVQSLNNSIKIEYQGNDCSASFIYNDNKTQQKLNLKDEVDIDFEIKKIWNWLKKS